MKGRGATKQPDSPGKAELGTHAERREEAEKRLLAAAVQIIAERGVDGMTLAEVGTAAGYSRGLPAHYFGNKTGLLEAVANHIADGFANRLAQTPQSKPGLDTLLRSIENFLTVTPRNRKHVVTLQAVIAESLTEPALRPTVMRVNERSLKRLVEMIRTGIRNGEIRRDIDPEHQAVMLLGTLRSFLMMWLINPREAELAAVRSALIASVRRALAN